MTDKKKTKQNKQKANQTNKQKNGGEVGEGCGEKEIEVAGMQLFLQPEVHLPVWSKEH